MSCVIMHNTLFEWHHHPICNQAHYDKRCTKDSLMGGPMLISIPHFFTCICGLPYVQGTMRKKIGIHVQWMNVNPTQWFSDQK